MSNNNLINQVSCHSFANLLKQTNHTEQGKAYLFLNEKTGSIAAICQSKGAANPGCHPLSFREITHIVVQFKSEYLKNSLEALPTALALERMSVNKTAHREKQFILVRLLEKIVDCVANYFNGHGFRTTESLALATSLELKKASVIIPGKPVPIPLPAQQISQQKPARQEPQPVPGAKPEPQPMPIPQPPQPKLKPAPHEPKPAEPKLSMPAGPQPQNRFQEPRPERQPILVPSPPPAIRTEPPQPSHSGQGKLKKKEVMAAYKESPWSMDDRRKLIVFKDITGIGNPYGVYVGDITSIEHLMKFVSDKSVRERGPADINHPKCVQVAVDVMKFCPELICDQLANWLSAQLARQKKANIEPPFNCDLLKKCLEVFVSKGSDVQRFSKYSLEQLLLIYMDSALEKARKAQLPLNDETIVKAIELMYRVSPNEKITVEKLTPWILGQTGYDLNLFIQWIKVFKVKEESSSAPNMYFPARDKLFEDFQKKAEWQKEMPLSPRSRDVLPYLRIKGVV